MVIMQGFERQLRRRGRALHQLKLPKGIDKVECCELFLNQKSWKVAGGQTSRYVWDGVEGEDGLGGRGEVEAPG